MGAGPVPSFDAFVIASSPRLRRLAFAWCRDWHEADDLVQVALEHVYRSWRRIRKRDDPFGYARTTLLRVLLADRRRARHGREVLMSSTPEPPPEAAPEPQGVAEALRHLPPRQRAVMLLRFVEDLSIAQTADALGISPGTVKSQTHDALKTLRAHLPAQHLAHRRPSPGSQT